MIHIMKRIYSDDRAHKMEDDLCDPEVKITHT